MTLTTTEANGTSPVNDSHGNSGDNKKCYYAAPYGCDNKYCWKSCGQEGKGEWCWLAQKEGNGPWTGCRSWDDWAVHCAL
ncbi:hypothetical protein BDW74DRAFT_182799 [Aspergillus multicolor]|uniref:uncharacterized protein n=1 Tax=Aspergillus multicolor TaxID=41759 RepID=UPI003CCE458E